MGGELTHNIRTRTRYAKPLDSDFEMGHRILRNEKFSTQIVAIPQETSMQKKTDTCISVQVSVRSCRQ